MIKMKTIKNKVLFLGSISVVAATIIESKDVSYIRSSSNVTNVQEAIEELYEKSKLSKKIPLEIMHGILIKATIGQAVVCIII